jgi:predicted dehydrogenase
MDAGKIGRRGVSRRAFLKGAAAAVALPTFVPASALGADGRAAPSERITLAMIGLGSMGLRHVKGFIYEKDCQLVAGCDCDAGRRRVAAEFVNEFYKNKDYRTYTDFREMIARDDIDALCIAVPDHWHAAMSIRCIRTGKDIYGEKPLALTVAEGRAMVEAVRRYNIIWQMGSWQRSTREFRFACELVRNQYIGELMRVEVCTGSGPRIDKPPQLPPHEDLDYEMWLGPAPAAPFDEKRCHWNFRWILDYSGGEVTDLGAHHIDIAHWGMDADATGPVVVSGKGEFPTDGLWDAAVEYDYSCTYPSGLVMHVASRNMERNGIKFIGEEGWVFVSRGRLLAEPNKLLRTKLTARDVHLARPRGDYREGHRRNFLDCVKSRNEPITPIEVGHNSIIPAHLANIAMLTGRAIRWDPKTERILNDPDAARMLTRPPREPWRM